jgi:hypothetical protein
LESNPFSEWGAALTNTARAQKQLGDLLKLAAQGLENLQELNLSWRKLWETPLLGFAPSSLLPLMSAFGFVPIQEHLTLVRRCEELKERVSAHEETIRHLRLLLKSEGSEKEGVEAGFHDLMKNQFDAFFRLMGSMQTPLYRSVFPPPKSLP